MKILIIEDEKDLADSLKDSLESECFAVDVAADGQKGMMLGCTNDYDLIILDNMLPKRSGAEVCKHIRIAKKQVPIIMLSVVSETNKKVELLNLGADDYLTKPFSFKELLARIKALLRRPKVIEDQIVRIRDLTLDFAASKVLVGKKEVYLTRKEFMLLEYLMKNKGVVVSRGMILEHVWDMDADPFSNTIESHILNLRKKIKHRGIREFIQTIPGRGYKIE
ncbi:MAG: response regulator transcription factor [Patescibacteria group bacterium]